MQRSAVVMLALAGLLATASWAEERVPASAKSESRSPAEDAGKLVPLNPAGTVLLDKEGRRILLKAKVVLRQGVLEMLLCRKQTKEHEAILALDAPAYVIHTGLLALGVEPGTPVQFTPEFQPPEGPKIDIFLQWTDQNGTLQRVAAQKWIRNQTRRYYVETLDSLPSSVAIPRDSELKYDRKHKELLWFGIMTDKQRDDLLALSDDDDYQKAIRTFHDRSQIREMTAEWVFAGSGFFVQQDEEGKEQRYYLAEDGDVICVANFPSAMIDIAEESSASGEENLLYEAYTERIPPIDTEVTVELIPVPAESKPE